MQYCISGRQQYSVLNKTDQVKVRWEDRERIIDFVERIPTKEIILEVKGVPETKDFETWKMYHDKFAEFYIAAYDLRLVDLLNMEHIHWYWPFPITSFYELNEIVKLDPVYVVLGPPLSFDLEAVKKIIGEHVGIRMVCNNAKPEYLNFDKEPNFFGQYIRPEDVKYYEKYVDVLEFDHGNDLKKEETLLRIYKDEQFWPGNLALLIDNFNYHVDNRGIPEDFGKARTYCKQRCQSGGRCRLCKHLCEFSTALRKEKFRRRKEAAIDNN